MKRARSAATKKLKELGYKSMRDLDKNGCDKDKMAVQLAYDLTQ